MDLAATVFALPDGFGTEGLIDLASIRSALVGEVFAKLVVP
jgi:hypothetical protein